MSSCNNPSSCPGSKIAGQLLLEPYKQMRRTLATPRGGFSQLEIVEEGVVENFTIPPRPLPTGGALRTIRSGAPVAPSRPYAPGAGIPLPSRPYLPGPTFPPTRRLSSGLPESQAPSLLGVTRRQPSAQGGALPFFNQAPSFGDEEEDIIERFSEEEDIEREVVPTFEPRRVTRAEALPTQRISVAPKKTTLPPAQLPSRPTNILPPTKVATAPSRTRPRSTFTPPPSSTGRNIGPITAPPRTVRTSLPPAPSGFTPVEIFVPETITSTRGSSVPPTSTSTTRRSKNYYYR